MEQFSPWDVFIQLERSQLEALRNIISYTNKLQLSHILEPFIHKIRI
jgi:hypothetical protein